MTHNACKYSRAAEDRRIWLRARPDAGRIVLEVEDRGPGVANRERRSIFRPFRRGTHADVITGGVGLGLALSQRWAHLLGGALTLHAAANGASGSNYPRKPLSWDRVALTCRLWRRGLIL